ncbi:MAG: putative nucleotide-diphospho-sugar transferase [Acetobacter sp.]
MVKRLGSNPYLQKINAIQNILSRYKAIFWLDDDAYFTDFNWRLSQELAKYPKVDLVICKSPLNEGRWTWISSGQFFLRNTERANQFLKAVLEVPPDLVRDWWNEEKFGLYTNGDQDSMVYVLATDKRFREGKFFVRLDYSAFNSREFHYKSHLNEHHLLHLASNIISKKQLLKQFIQRIGVNQYLVPDEILARYDLSSYAEMDYLGADH